MEYKTRIEVIGQMLEDAKDFINEGYRDRREPISELKAMYKRFSHYSGFSEYLAFLLENDLLTYIKNESRYRLTGRGLRFLRLYVELSKMISNVQTHRTSEQNNISVYKRPLEVADLSVAAERRSLYNFI